MVIEVTEKEKEELQEIINLLKTEYASETYTLGRSLAISLKERFKGYYIYYDWEDSNGKAYILDPNTIRPNQLYATFDFDAIIDRIESDLDWNFFYRDLTMVELIQFIQLILKENNHFVRKNDC